MYSPDKSNDKTERLGKAFTKVRTKTALNSTETKSQNSNNLLESGDNSADDRRMDDECVIDNKTIQTEAIKFPNQKTNEANIDTKIMINHQKHEMDIQNIVRTNNETQHNIKSDDNHLLQYSNDRHIETDSTEKDNNIGKRYRPKNLINEADKTKTETIEESKEMQVESKASPLTMPSNLMSEILSKYSKGNSKRTYQYAPCGLWDFAGQREFYATHQAFLTSSGIYLLVASMKEEVEKKDVSFAEFGKIGGM